MQSVPVEIYQKITSHLDEKTIFNLDLALQDHSHCLRSRTVDYHNTKLPKPPIEIAPHFSHITEAKKRLGLSKNKILLFYKIKCSGVPYFVSRNTKRMHRGCFKISGIQRPFDTNVWMDFEAALHGMCKIKKKYCCLKTLKSATNLPRWWIVKHLRPKPIRGYTKRLFTPVVFLFDVKKSKEIIKKYV